MTLQSNNNACQKIGKDSKKVEKLEDSWYNIN